MTDLQVLVRAWRQSTDDLIGLVAELDQHEWERPTDCPGWTVRDIVAHLAAIEDELASGDASSALAEGTREVPSAYTQAGVDARAHHSPAELLAELRAATSTRADQLAEVELDDPRGAPDRTPGGIGWDWQTLLRNRAIDVWVHEQDIRRATRRPGAMHSAGADIVHATFAAALPYIVGKRAGVPPGTNVVIQVDDAVTAYSVDDSGRCRWVDHASDPSTTLRMDRETFTLLGAGRRDPAACQVAVEGDARLAKDILRAMAVTP